MPGETTCSACHNVAASSPADSLALPNGDTDHASHHASVQRNCISYDGPKFLSALGAWLRSPTFVMPAILVVVALLLYAPALGGSFVYFDRFEIQGNPAVTTPTLWLQNFTYSAGNTLAGRGYYYRPLYFLPYGLVYYFAGPQPLAFHLLQLIFFAATVWMFFRVGCELFDDTGLAFAGTLLWAMHPAHVEAVAWISSLYLFTA